MIILCDKQGKAFSSLKRDEKSMELLKAVQAEGARFFDCPDELSAMLSGKDPQEAHQKIINDLWGVANNEHT